MRSLSIKHSKGKKPQVIVKKISNRGTADPIVARTVLQTKELIGFSSAMMGDKAKSDFLEFALNIKKRLVRCDDVRCELLLEIGKIDKIISTGNLNNEVPQIHDLEGRCENFLFSARLVLSDLSEIFRYFFKDEKFNKDFRKTKIWCDKKFGKNDELCRLLEEDNNWIKKIIDMRDAIAHPNRSQYLRVENIDLHESGKFVFPIWYLAGEEPSDMIADMEIFVKNLLTFFEDLVVLLIKKTLHFKGIDFAIIPEEERNLECPIRIKVVLTQINSRN